MDDKYKQDWNKILADHKIKQIKLSEILGYSPAKISQFMSDKNNFSLELFNEIKYVLALKDSECILFKLFIDNIQAELDAKRALVGIYRNFNVSKFKKTEYYRSLNLGENVSAIKLYETIYNYINYFSNSSLSYTSAEIYQRFHGKPAIAEFNRDDLINLLYETHIYTTYANGFSEFSTLLNKCGVYVMQIDGLSKGDSSHHHFDGRPVIALSSHTTNTAKLWNFLIYEALCAIIEKDDYGMITDEFGYEPILGEQRKRIHVMIKKIFKKKEIIRDANKVKLSKGEIKASDIDLIVKINEIGKDIVIYVLQQAKIIGYTRFNELRTLAPKLENRRIEYDINKKSD